MLQVLFPCDGKFFGPLGYLLFHHPWLIIGWLWKVRQGPSSNSKDMTHCFCLGIASIPEWLNCKPVNQRYFNRNIIIFFNQNNFCFIRVMILLPRSDFVGTWSSPRVSHRRVIWPNPETLWWLWWVTESFGVFNRSRYLLLLRSFKHPIKKSFSPFWGFQPSRPSQVSKSQWLMESFWNRKFQKRGSMTLRVI